MADTNQVLGSLPKPKRNASKEMKMKQTNKNQKPSNLQGQREWERRSQQWTDAGPAVWKTHRECELRWDGKRCSLLAGRGVRRKGERECSELIHASIYRKAHGPGTPKGSCISEVELKTRSPVRSLRTEVRAHVLSSTPITRQPAQPPWSERKRVACQEALGPGRSGPYGTRPSGGQKWELRVSH